MSNAKTINIALIGYGFVGKTFHAPLIQSIEGLNLAIVASRDEEKVKRDLPDVTVIASPEAAIQHPEVDLVVIASPNATHAPLARLALNSGKHVVVDKPFTLDMQEARELIALAEEKQRVLSVFHNRRWDSDYLGVKQVIEQGLIGKVKHFESHFDRFRPEVRVRWREQNVPGSGLWFDLGPHLIDQTLQLFGLPQSVQGNIATLREGAEINDWAHVVLNYPQHKVVLHCSMLVAGGVARFTVHGDKGSVVKQRADRQESQLLAGVTPGSQDWGQDDDSLVLYDADLQSREISAPQGDQRQYYIHVRDALTGKINNPVSPLEALAVMAVLEAAVKSAESGTTQTLALTAEELAGLKFSSLAPGVTLSGVSERACWRQREAANKAPVHTGLQFDPQQVAEPGGVGWRQPVPFHLPATRNPLPGKPEPTFFTPIHKIKHLHQLFAVGARAIVIKQA